MEKWQSRHSFVRIFVIVSDFEQLWKRFETREREGYMIDFDFDDADAIQFPNSLCEFVRPQPMAENDFVWT